jgi:tetratricopeptide (TPR) repeat protein
MSTTPTCIGCGAALNEGAHFCSRCGKRVAPEPPSSLPTDHDEGFAREQKEVGARPDEPIPDARSDQTLPRRRRWLWPSLAIVIGVLVAGLLASVAWWHHSTTPEYAVERYVALLNEGKTVEASKWLQPPVLAYVGPAGIESMYRGQDVISVIDRVEVDGDRGIATRSFRKPDEPPQAEAEPPGSESAAEMLGARVTLSRTEEGWRLADCGLLLSRTIARDSAGQHNEALEGTTLLREVGCEHAVLDEVDARIHLEIGQAAYDAGAYEKATEALQRSLRILELPEAHYALGYVFRDNKNLTNNQSRAADEFREAVRMAPGNADYRSSLADVYRQMENYKGAIDEFERALALNPSNIQTRYFFALALLGDNRHSAAAKELQRVVDIDSDYRNARELLERVREYQRAEARRKAFLRQLQTWY